MSRLQRPKGTQDIFGDEAAKWQYVESSFRNILERSGYQEIRTPILEHTELFKRSVGEATDIVKKEMYTFEKEERSLTLRPEGTAGVVRSYIEQGMSRWSKPVKLFYFGPMFRYERPQAGRQRQFHQLGIEVFGLDTPDSDAEIIFLVWQIFKALGLPELALEINNIGTPEERKSFKNNLRDVVLPFTGEHGEKLCSDCGNRLITNPMRILDCKVETCQAIYAQPEIQKFLETDFTGEASRKHYEELTAMLTGLGIPFKRNYKLVRGLDYYTKTVFEITSTHLGAQNAVCGGGRYNDLVALLGGEPTPATGWALGMERLISLLPDPPKHGLDYYIVTDQTGEALALASRMRIEQECSVEVDLSGRGFGKQLESANKRQARFAIILGEAEAAGKTLGVKNLATGEQVTQSLTDLSWVN